MSETKNVQVRQSQVRSTPSFLGKILATVSYGDKVQIVSEEGGWSKVKIKGVSGWMHDSALTTAEIIVSAGGGAVTHSASSDELALAGKGFTKQVEDKFRQSNKNLNFAMVDSIEKIVVSEVEIREFLTVGKLRSEGDEA